MLVKVCCETRRNYTWYFDSDAGKYVRFDSENKQNAFIDGTELPNPANMEYARRKAIKEGKLHPGARIACDPVTVKLWEHWNAQLNNEL